MAINTQSALSRIFTRTGTVAFAAAAIMLPACGNPTPEVDVSENDVSTDVTENDASENEMAATMDNNVTTEDLSENLANYLGETVSVREEVEEVVSDSAFLLDEDQLFGGEEILIINASGQPVDLVEGDDTDVQVTGEVRELILADLEQEFGFDLDNEAFVEYEQQPVIVAQSIALAPDPDDITDNPEDYYYRRIALNGDIGSVIDTNIATIDDKQLFGGEDILAVSPSEDFMVQEGEEVVMTGVLRPLITSEIEQEYNLTWDLDLENQIEAEFQDRPVLIVDSVYPSAI